MACFHLCRDSLSQGVGKTFRLEPFFTWRHWQVAKELDCARPRASTCHLLYVDMREVERPAETRLWIGYPRVL